MANRVSIRPSALGSKGILLFAVLELAFLATDYSNLFFLLLSFSAVIGLLSAWWSLRNLRGLQIEDVEIERASAGSSRSIRLLIAAAKRPRFDLMLETNLTQGKTQVSYTALLTGTQRLSTTIPGQSRGIQRLQAISVSSNFPFGLFVAKSKLPITSEVVTYPDPKAFRINEHAEHQTGEHAKLIPGRGAALAGLRAFRTGDNVADVDWKATARRGSAVVKERECETEREVKVVLDRRCQHEAFERALSQVTSLTLAACHRSPLRIQSQGIDILINANQDSSRDAIRWLATTTALPSDAAPPPTDYSAIQLPEVTRSS